MKNILTFVLVSSFFSCTQTKVEDTPKLLEVHQSVKPWKQYIGDNSVSSLLDFSAVGVNYSNSGIPNLALPIFDVTDYGAIANDNEEDKQAIQQAIYAAENAGGGIVHFPTGRFLINEQSAGSSIVISGSKVILQGSGNGLNGTELFMRQALKPTDPSKKWTVPSMIKFKPSSSSSPSTTKQGKYIEESVIVADSAAQSHFIRVKHPERFKAGDLITIDMQNTAANDDFLLGKEPRFNWAYVRNKGVQVKETLELDRVEDNRLYFKQPLITRIKSDYGWKVRSVNFISNVGIENLRFSGNFQEEFVHHKNAYHDSGFSAVSLTNTTHSWVRNVVFSQVSNAASISGGVANSIILNVIEGNRGHASFGIQFGTRNITALNIDVTNNGQWHGPGASHLSVGSVIWRFISPKSRGIDSHGAFPRYTLFDKVTSNGFGGWGGNFKNLPNHLEGLVFWNFVQTGEKVGEWHKGKFNFWDVNAPKEQPYTFFSATNPTLVGYEGTATGYQQDQVELITSFGKNVPLDSLYEAQLKYRLGEQPVWMTEALQDWNDLQERFLSL